MFKHLKQITTQRYEVEKVKPDIEHREPKNVIFFVLQYGKQRMLKLHKFLQEIFWRWQEYEEFEMDTHSLSLALSEEHVGNIILPEKLDGWNVKSSRRYTDTFTANAFRSPYRS